MITTNLKSLQSTPFFTQRQGSLAQSQARNQIAQKGPKRTQIQSLGTLVQRLDELVAFLREESAIIALLLVAYSYLQGKLSLLHGWIVDSVSH